jgi:hypothetical protein
MAWSILAASLTDGPTSARSYAEKVVAMISPDPGTERVIRFLIDAEIHRPRCRGRIDIPAGFNGKDRERYSSAIHEGRFRDAYVIAQLDATARLRIHCELFLASFQM